LNTFDWRQLLLQVVLPQLKMLPEHLTRIAPGRSATEAKPLLVEGAGTGAWPDDADWVALMLGVRASFKHVTVRISDISFHLVVTCVLQVRRRRTRGDELRAAAIP
jgi:hypothetical protein